MIEIFGNPATCVATLRADPSIPSLVGNAVAALLQQYERKFVRVRVGYVPGAKLVIEIASVDPKLLEKSESGPEPLR